MIVPLRDALDRARFGGKGAQLARALQAGLPVPGGYALSVEAVEAVAAGARPFEVPEGRWAVRSSATDEDGAGTSFAGQHCSLLHQRSEAVIDAVRTVHASGSTEAARAYRTRLGLSAAAGMAVVVQRMVEARVAGVMFTRNPTSGARELVIEAAWGLGEVVVQGLVTPDAYRLTHEGGLLEHRAGYKDLEIVPTEEGTAERAVAEPRATSPTLGPTELGRLVELAAAVAGTFEGAHDLEWAFDHQGELHLLQRRSITR